MEQCRPWWAMGAHYCHYFWLYACDKTPQKVPVNVEPLSHCSAGNGLAVRAFFRDWNVFVWISRQIRSLFLQNNNQLSIETMNRDVVRDKHSHSLLHAQSGEL